MSKKPVVATLLVLAILGAAVWIYRGTSDRQPRIQMGPYEALGEVAAQETIHLLNGKGKVVIIASEASTGANPVERTEVEVLDHSLKRGGVSVEVIERFSLPPAARMMGSSVPRDWFLKVVQAHPNAAGLVILAEFPVLEASDLEQLKKRGAAIVLISGNPTTAKQLLDDGVVGLAICPRLNNSSQEAKQPQSTREWFDRNFVILAKGAK